MNESLLKLSDAFAEERLRISTHKRPGEIRDCGICGPVLESTDAAFTAVGMEMDELKRARDDARRERDALHVLDQCLRWRSQGVAAIAAERQRQVESEGWTPEHDAHHANGELIEAAVAYLRYELLGTDGDADWPFEQASFKPSENPIRNLEKAGALVAAEIDRLYDRKAREAQGA